MVVILLIITAVCQLVGTASVAINYYRTSSTAKSITDHFNPNFSVPFAERDRLNSLMKELTPRLYLTFGLIAYAVGAITGLLAGLAAYYHW